MKVSDRLLIVLALLILPLTGCGPEYQGQLLSPDGRNVARIVSYGGSALDSQYVSITVSGKDQESMLTVFSGPGSFYGKLQDSEPSIHWVTDKHLAIERTLQETKTRSCFPSSGVIVVSCDQKGK